MGANGAVPSDVIRLRSSMPQKFITVFCILLIAFAGTVFAVDGDTALQRIVGCAGIALAVVLLFGLIRAIVRRGVLIDEKHARIGFDTGISRRRFWTDLADVVYVHDTGTVLSLSTPISAQWTPLAVASTKFRYVTLLAMRGGMRGLMTLGWRTASQIPKDVIKELEEIYGAVYPFLIEVARMPADDRELLLNFLNEQAPPRAT